MAIVRLTGHISCCTETEAAILRAHLPAHAALSRAEDGCLSFSVKPDGARRWRVSEAFVDEDAFAAHQRRTAASAWGRVTAGFARDYAVTRDADPPAL